MSKAAATMSLAVAAMACALGGASAGAAQQMSREDAVRIPHDYAACFVQRNRRAVVRILESIPGSREEFALVDRLVARDRFCLARAWPHPQPDEASIAMRPHMIRGQMAEALFEHDFWRVGQPQVSVLARQPGLDALRARTDLGEITRTSADFGAAAMCVVQAQPETASRLLGTDPASPEEAAVIGELQPEVERCSESDRVRFNRVSLRGFIAEGLYRQSAALAGRAG